jgi:hypothetical protein
MHRDNRQTLEERVVQAAEAALADHGYVSLIDLFTGMRLLQPAHVESWRKGRLEFLEPWIQGNPNKIPVHIPAMGERQRAEAQRDPLRARRA